MKYRSFLLLLTLVAGSCNAGTTASSWSRWLTAPFRNTHAWATGKHQPLSTAADRAIKQCDLDAFKKTIEEEGGRDLTYPTLLHRLERRRRDCTPEERGKVHEFSDQAILHVIKLRKKLGVEVDPKSKKYQEGIVHVISKDNDGTLLPSLFEQVPTIDFLSGNCDGNTPTHFFAQHNNTAGVIALLRQADRQQTTKILLTRENNAGADPLDTAIGAGAAHVSDALITRMIGRAYQNTNGYPTLLDKRNAAGNTRLHRAITSSQVIALQLVCYGVRFDLLNNRQETAFHCASGHPNMDPVFEKMLERLKETRDPAVIARMFQQKNSKGENPLIVALRSGRKQRSEHIMVLLVERKIPVDGKNAGGETVIHLAAGQGFSDVMEECARSSELLGLEPGFLPALEMRTNNGQTALHYAAAGDQAETVKWLIRQTPQSLNAADRRGQTPLHFVAGKKAGTTLDVLLAHPNITVNARNTGGETPLFVACSKGILSSMRLLLKHGANPNIATCDSHTTPLMIAATRRNGAKFVDELLQGGADPNRKNDHGKNALHVALEFNHCAVTASLLASKANANERVGSGWKTPLHIAVESGCSECVERLLDHQADPDKTVGGQTPLHTAVLLGRVDCVTKFTRTQRVNPNVRDERGVTPAHRALTLFHQAVGEQIIRQLACHPSFDPNARDGQGRSLLWHSVGNGHVGAVKALLAHRAIEVNRSEWESLLDDPTQEKIEIAEIFIDHWYNKNQVKHIAAFEQQVNVLLIKYVGTRKGELLAKMRLYAFDKHDKLTSAHSNHAAPPPPTNPETDPRHRPSAPPL